MPTKDKELKAKHQKTWYEKHKKEHIRNVAKRRKQVIAENKKRMISTGFTCEHCGEKDFVVMEFHHLNPKEKDADIGKLLSGGYSWERIQREIAKCIPLCANCHRREHYRLRQMDL